jgi:intein/homing endonuclease
VKSVANIMHGRFHSAFEVFGCFLDNNIIMSSRINEYFEKESLGSQLIFTLKSLQSQSNAIESFNLTDHTELRTRQLAKLHNSREEILFKINKLLKEMEVNATANTNGSSENIQRIHYQLKIDIGMKKMKLHADPTCKNTDDWKSDVVDVRLLKD